MHERVSWGKISQPTADLPTPGGPQSHRTGMRSSFTGSPFAAAAIGYWYSTQAKANSAG